MTYNPLLPLSTTGFAQSQIDITTNFNQANLIFGVNHINYDNSLPAGAIAADRGKHAPIVVKRIEDPPAVPYTIPVTGANEAGLYARVVTGGTRTEAYYRYPGAGPETQLSYIKAWVKFAGTTAVVADSYNVAGVVRNGAGDYTITFTTALTNANYIVNITPACGLSGSGIGAIPGVNAQAVGTCRIFTKALSANLGTDPASVHVLIVGT